ncbi:MAG: hypothetical protein AB1896_12095 [Thermodesulfobacteriota bacterium]
MSAVRLIVLLPLALFFLAFGVVMLISSYHQDHPVAFLAMFFSSSLIVLLSLTCLVGLVWRAVTRKGPPEETDP